MITSPAHAIELLGGSKVVADHVDRPLTTVASWGTRQSIPVDVWPAMVALADEKQVGGFTYEDLVRVHAQAVPPKRKVRAA